MLTGESTPQVKSPPIVEYNKKNIIYGGTKIEQIIGTTKVKFIFIPKEF